MSVIDKFSSTQASKLLQNLFDEKIFDYSKPVDLTMYLMQRVLKEKSNDLILDFFSGSAITAHVIMQLNVKDGSNRRFIMVQLPEVCDDKSEACKAGYANTCKIGKERTRRIGKRVLEADGEQTSLDGDEPSIDVGFKVFKSNTSNLKLWEDTPIEDGDVAILFNRIDKHIDGLKPNRSDEDLIYEILLKVGYSSTADLAALDVDRLTVYKVDNGEMLICLQDGITTEHIEQMAAFAS